jgi:hypothetical protein
VYADAGYQGIEKRLEMGGKVIGFRVAMRPGKRRALPNTPEGRLDDLLETAKGHIRAKGDQAAVLISEDPAAGHAQEPQKGERADSPCEPIHGASSVAMQHMSGRVVCLIGC